MKKIALIGIGYWGSIIKDYIPIFFSLKYIANSKFDLRTIWNDKEVKAVIIATPIDTHYRLTMEALTNGKHVFVEKPVSLRFEEASEIKEIAKRNNLKVCVEYTQTFSESIKTCVNQIFQMGYLKYIEMSVKHLGRFMPFDVYWLLASHQLSILDMICPLDQFEFSNIDHLIHNGLCTTGSVFFEAKNHNLRGKIDVSTNFPGKEVLANFYFDKATIKYNALDKHSLILTQYNKKPKVLPPELMEEEKLYTFDEKNNLRHAIHYFLSVLEGKESDNLDRAIRITNVLESFARHI